MLYFLEQKKDCTGCGACMTVCPVQCIAMEEDEEGFLYPVSDQSCISCGKCEAACRRRMASDGSRSQRAYAAVSRDREIWRRSSSGGAFSEICKAFAVEGEIAAAGAAWDGFRVHHVFVEGIENIAVLCKSKYMESFTGDTFFKCNEYLEKGQRVVFCGTPCQVAGLKATLWKDYKNLLTIDLICHGAGSPKVFQSCIKALEQQFGEEICAYEFRAKERVYAMDYITAVTFRSGKRYLFNDQYTQLFLQQKCLRPSCGEHCKYRTQDRQGDFTIADFKGLDKVFPACTGTKVNYSSIVVNSAKGMELLPELRKSMKVMECSIDDIKKYNPLFYRQGCISKGRNSFFEEYAAFPDDTVVKYTNPAAVYKRSIKRRILDVLPQALRGLLLKTLRL